MQTVHTKYMDDVKSAHPVTWCDAAEPHAYMSSTVITVGSEKDQKRDISGDLSPDIPSDIVGILETDGILPEKVDGEENEGISRQDPAADGPGAATRSTSIPPPPPGRGFRPPAWARRSRMALKALQAPRPRPSGVFVTRRRPTQLQALSRPVSSHTPFFSRNSKTTPTAKATHQAEAKALWGPRSDLWGPTPP